MAPSLRSSCYALLTISGLFSSLSSSALHVYPDRALAARAEVFKLQARANTKDIRLMPVGDSITVGVASSDGNGWRLDLDNMLKYVGYNPSFVGGHRNGTNNPDNEDEGFGGYWIYDILKSVVADDSLSLRPNLVVLMAGTNDLTWDDESNTQDYANAPARLGNLIDYVLCGCPDAVVLVAKLIKNVVHQSQVDTYNAQIPSVVQQRVNQGFKLQVVDQSQIEGPEFLHPNDTGYNQMAWNYLTAIQNIPDGWLTEPVTPTTPPLVSGCTPSYNPPISTGVLGPSGKKKRQIFAEAMAREKLRLKQ